MAIRKALVTLAIGKRYQNNFDRHCKNLWNAYADKHGFDLIVITDRLDNSPRAQTRSAAWQKCLILSHEAVQKYDQVVWVDSDILINPCSPDICAEVPIEKIGAVDEFAMPSKEEHTFYLERTYDYWSKQGVDFINSLSATDFHNDFGLDGAFNAVVQTGVMVLSPANHRELLEHVYFSYEDKGPACYNYEMRPLSFEILKNEYEFWLSSKFNLLWIYWKQFHYPFLDFHHNSTEKLIEKALRKMKIDLKAKLKERCATTTFLNSYFLHFAGTSNDMKFVKTSYSSVFNIP